MTFVYLENSVCDDMKIKYKNGLFSCNNFILFFINPFIKGYLKKKQKYLKKCEKKNTLKVDFQST